MVKFEKSVLCRFIFCFCPLNPNNELENYSYIKPHPTKQKTHHILLCKKCGCEYTAYMKSFIGKDQSRCRCGAREKYEKTMIERYGDVKFNNPEKFKNTMIEKYGSITYNNQEKIKETNLEKYGNTSYLRTENGKQRHIERINSFTEEKKKDIQIKLKETLRSKYGVTKPYDVPGAKDNGIKTIENKYGSYDSYLSVITKKTRITRVNRGDWIDIEKTKGFQKYKRQIIYYTNESKRKLWNEWNGYDYYDGEYIKQNLYLNCRTGLKPSIDHKISKMFGYLHSIDPKTIGGFENLCITKHFINAKKRHRTEFEFKLIFNGIKLLEYHA